MSHGVVLEASPKLAALFVAMGAFCFSLMGLFVKLSEEHFSCSSFSLIAIRSGIGLVLNRIAIMVDFGRSMAEGSDAGQFGTTQDFLAYWGAPSTRAEWIWLAYRCLGGVSCICFEYAALKVLPLATNTMIVYSSPAFIVLWAAVLLGEPIKLPVMVCMGICFSGVVLIVEPWSHNLTAPVWAYTFSAAAAALAGLVYVSLKELKGVRFHFVLNAFMLTSLILSVTVGAAIGDFQLPPLGSPAWGHLFAVALTSYAAEVCVTVGFAKATPETLGQVSVLKFLSPIFSLVWGFVFLSTTPTPVQFVGMFLVILASATLVVPRPPESSLEEFLAAERSDKVEPLLGARGLALNNKSIFHVGTDKLAV